MLKVNKVGYLYMFSIVPVITTKTVTEEEKVLVAKHLHCSHKCRPVPISRIVDSCLTENY